MGNIYFGVNNVARKVKKIYFGVDNKARKVKKIYIGINGKARLVWQDDIETFLLLYGNIILYSKDGLKSVTNTGVTSSETTGYFTYHDGFYGIAYDTSAGKYKLFESFDGVSFNKKTLPIDIASLSYSAFSYDGVTMVFANQRRLWISTNKGVSWTERVSSFGQCDGVANKGNTIIFTPTGESYLMYSLDNGVTWTNSTLRGYDDGFTGTTYARDRFFTCRYESSPYSGEPDRGSPQTSTDGINWTTINVGRNWTYKFMKSGNYYTVSAASVNSIQEYMLYSSNATSWTLISAIARSENTRTIVYNGKNYYSQSNGYFVSTNNITATEWTKTGGSYSDGILVYSAPFGSV